MRSNCRCRGESQSDGAIVETPMRRHGDIGLGHVAPVGVGGLSPDRHEVRHRLAQAPERVPEQGRDGIAREEVRSRPIEQTQVDRDVDCTLLTHYVLLQINSTSIDYASSEITPGVDPGVADVHDDVADQDQGGADDRLARITGKSRLRAESSTRRPGPARRRRSRRRPSRRSGAARSPPKPVQTGRKAFRRT